MNDCEAEAAETQTWLEFAVQCNYMETETGQNSTELIIKF